MKKRLVLVLVVCLCVGLLAAGCAPKEPEASASAEPETSAPSEETAAPAAEATEITLWNYWETPKHQETLGRVVDEFNASQDSVVLTTEYIPFADFKKQLSIGVVSDQLPDIVIIDNPDHAAYASMGIFADLTDKLADWPDLEQYYEGPVNSATLEGRLYGLPFGSNCLALYYNEDMLSAAGCEVPTTWDELLTVAKATTVDGIYGLGVSAPQNEEGTFQFMPWLWSTGATSFEINTAGGINALTLYQDLITEGAMSKEVINWTQGDVMNQFISGNLAMMVNGPWQVPTMRAEAPDLNWSVALLPKDAQNASVLGGENFAIINNDNVDASLSFLKFVASPDMMKTYINDFGYIASRQDVSETQFTDDPIMQAFADEMQYAQPRGPHPRWPEISNAISTAFSEVLTEVSDPATAAQKAQDTIDGIIQ
jgi:multiple sugar transport system substrate-binding protein